MKQKIIKVKTKSKNYEVHIGTNLIPKLKNILKKNKLLFSKCLIVIESVMIRKYKDHESGADGHRHGPTGGRTAEENQTAPARTSSAQCCAEARR